MQEPFFVSLFACHWVGVNAVGLAVLVFWGWRDKFDYRGAQPAGEGHAETVELKQVAIDENSAPFGFQGGLSRNRFRLFLAVYAAGVPLLVSLFFALVPEGLTLGEYLRSQAPATVWVSWLALLLLLHVFHWAAVVKRLRATRKNPWGMVLTAPIPPLYWVNLAALAVGEDGVKPTLRHD